MAYDDDFRFNPIRSLRNTKDGEYVIEIRIIYRGREFRLSLAGRAAVQMSIFPLGGRVGTRHRRAELESPGDHLPMEAMTGVYPLLWARGLGFPSCPFGGGYAAGSAGTRTERPARKRNRSPPGHRDGRVDRLGLNLFRFEGRAGSVIVAEVHARRLNSPLDSVLRLTGRRPTIGSQ